LGAKKPVRHDGEAALKVSAVIPTYNRRTQVLGAIASVLQQTVPVDEIVVVDDGSTDGTAESIVSRYGAGVTVVRQENAGVSAARNRGIRAAQGEWIAFLDSDDLWMPTKIERQLEALQKFESEAELCFADCVLMGLSPAGNQPDGSPDASPDPAVTVFGWTGFAPARQMGLLEKPTQWMLEAREPFCIQSVVARRSLLVELGGFDETLLLGEDSDLFFRLSFKTGFCYAAEPLVRVDRTPARSLGLSTLYATVDDRLFDNWERRYRKWLAMPEVSGTAYESPVREFLREASYNSVESKLHQFRIGPALREIGRLREIERGYGAIAATLLQRKTRKFWRKVGGPEQPGPGKHSESGIDLA
jgi:glycosyltransferase involved in cell wall biosynthesis